VAIHALGGKMWTLERETALPVNICNIFNNPGSWGMTPGTIHPYSLVVHVGVAAGTVCLSLGENKGWMTQSAIDHIMLPLQGQTGSIVIKRVDFMIQFPSIGTMTFTAAYFKIIPVG
jgi:hypothetical protein